MFGQKVESLLKKLVIERVDKIRQRCDFLT